MPPPSALNQAEVVDMLKALTDEVDRLKRRVTLLEQGGGVFEGGVAGGDNKPHDGDVPDQSAIVDAPPIDVASAVSQAAGTHAGIRMYMCEQVNAQRFLTQVRQ